MPKTTLDTEAKRWREEVARRIRAVLRDLPYNQTEVAEKIGVSPSTITGWKQGTDIPGGENLMRFSRLSGERVAFLMADRLPRQESLEELGRELASVLGKRRLQALLTASEGASREAIDHAIGRLLASGELEQARKSTPRSRRR